MRWHLVVGLAVSGFLTTAIAVPATATDVALFFNPTYVDTANEGASVEQSLIDQGFTVFTFTGITADAINAATSGRQVLAFPSLEVRPLSPDLDLNANFAIASFVANQAGTLLMFNSGNGDPLAIINNAFSVGATAPNQVFHMTAVSATGPIIKTAGAGSPFANGPGTLNVNDFTTAVLASSLPSGAQIAYADANGNGVVVWLPPNTNGVTGGGNIVILGWDWFNACTSVNQTNCQDSGWADVLKIAASLTGTAQIPTLSEWAMIAMVGLLVALGVRALRHGRLLGRA